METFQILKQFIKYDLASEHVLSDLDEDKPPLVTGIIDSLRILKLFVFIEKKFSPPS
jgi:acyl carrier protein